MEVLLTIVLAGLALLIGITVPAIPMVLFRYLHIKVLNFRTYLNYRKIKQLTQGRN